MTSPENHTIRSVSDLVGSLKEVVDTHLVFIGLGLENCVTSENRPDLPVYFIDLDGVYRDTHRRQQTTVVGFNKAEAGRRASNPRAGVEPCHRLGQPERPSARHH